MRPRTNQSGGHEPIISSTWRKTKQKNTSILRLGASGPSNKPNEWKHRCICFFAFLLRLPWTVNIHFTYAFCEQKYVIEKQESTWMWCKLISEKNITLRAFEKRERNSIFQLEDVSAPSNARKLHCLVWLGWTLVARNKAVSTENHVTGLREIHIYEIVIVQKRRS